MAPTARVKAAFQAMENIGISKHKTKPALKKLLKLFDKNWDLIEEENYRVLADTIFEYEDTEAAEKEKIPANTDQGDALVEEPPTQDEPERPLKRLRKKYQDQDVPSNGQASPSSSAFVLKIPKPEPGEVEVPFNQLVESMTGSDDPNVGNKRSESPRPVRDKGKQPISPTPHVASRNNRAATQRASQALKIKEPMPEGVGITAKPKQSITNALIKPKDEPFTGDMVSLECPAPECLPQEPPSELGNTVGSHDGKGSGLSKSVNGVDNRVETVPLLTIGENHLKESVSEISPTQMAIAASPLGEVKISLSYNHDLKGHDFRVPDVQVVMKKVEENCVKTYKIMNPEFSLTKVMADVCESALQLGTNGEHITQEKLNSDDPVAAANRGTLGFALPVNGSVNAERSDNLASNSSTAFRCQQICPQSDSNGSDNHSVERDSNIVADGNTKSLVTVDQPPSPDDMRRAYDMNDITRGKEEVKVSLEKSNSEFSPSFHYISQNLVSHNANVTFSLAQIGDMDNCSCLGDCSSLSCNCLQRNRGECPYTSNGLVREEFLGECISIVRNPQKHDLMYCKECPLEKSKNEDMMDPCKGHLKRKFIKECWTKCGCSKNCGNQVVQQGIRCNLQVFWTSEGKGWGLRTLGELPKGAFVCEYVGEILTNTELHERNVIRSNEKHSYSVLLDTDWGSRALKEDELLCLDASFYGNVARFINHRCTDANLIEIPIEVETPNHHYYHIALFTTRKVDAFEELTWDYGIHFDDNEHHTKTFSCLCGSKFCQNMKRSSRSRPALR